MRGLCDNERNQIEYSKYSASYSVVCSEVSCEMVISGHIIIDQIIAANLEYHAIGTCKITPRQQHCLLVILGPTLHELKQMCDFMMQGMSFTSTASHTLSTCMLPLCTAQHHYCCPLVLSCVSVNTLSWLHILVPSCVYKLVFTVSSPLFGYLVQNGSNAMHMAAQGGHIEVITFLLPYFGARVHDKDGCAFTMLHWAAQMGHSQVARYLINEFQMDPQDRDKVCGVPGGTRSVHHSRVCVC